MILMDVLQTKEGQKYLSSCGSDSNQKMQIKRRPREGQSERRSSTEHNSVRRRASAPHKEQDNSSQLKLANPPSTKTTASVCADENNRHLSKEVESPAVKRCKRFSNSLNQTEQTLSHEEASCSFKENDKNKEHSGLWPDTLDNELCPFEESDSPRPVTVSPLHSEESDSERMSESLITATDFPSQDEQPSIFYRTECQDTESRNPTEVRFPNKV